MGTMRNAWNALMDAVTRIPGDLKAGLRDTFSFADRNRQPSFVTEAAKPRAVTGEHRILNYAPAHNGGWNVETEKGFVPEDNADLRI